MVKLEWGTKRTCTSCASRFYDLQRSPIHCPKCGTVYEVQTTSRRGRRTAVDDAKIIPFVGEEVLLDADLDIGVDVERDLDDDTLIEDADDLGEDLDEMADVLTDDDEDNDR